MKRSASGASKRPFDWSLCFVCQKDIKKKKVRHTDNGIKSLSANLLRFWKAGLLDIDISDVVSFTDGEPDFYKTLSDKKAPYHHDCCSPYRKDVKVIVSTGTVASSSCMHQTRSQTAPMPFNTCFCVFCTESDSDENLHAAGTKHASKTKVDSDHIQSLTDKWKMMAAFLGKDNVLSRLATGNLAANAIFYHLDCLANFYREYNVKYKSNAVDNGESSSGITNQQIKDLAFSEVLQ